MPTLVTLVDGTIPVAADFNGNYTALNNAIGSSTAISGYTTGDTLYASATNTLSKLTKGAEGTSLAMGSSSIPVWSMRDEHQTRFEFVSTTSVKVLPYKGRLLPVKTSGAWALRDISSSGIASGDPTGANNYVNGVASTALSASTNYLVCVFDNAGVLTLDFVSTLTHTQDSTTGVEIKNGDDTRTVVGLIATDASKNFSSGALSSWYNRRRKILRATFSTTRTITSAGFTEVNSEIRIPVTTWGEESVALTLCGVISLGTANQTHITGIGVDGSVVAGARVDQFFADTNNHGLSASSSYQPSEGGHTYSVFGAVTGGVNANWFGDGGFGSGSVCLTVAWMG